MNATNNTPAKGEVVEIKSAQEILVDYIIKQPKIDDKYIIYVAADFAIEAMESYADQFRQSHLSEAKGEESVREASEIFEQNMADAKSPAFCFRIGANWFKMHSGATYTLDEVTGIIERVKQKCANTVKVKMSEDFGLYQIDKKSILTIPTHQFLKRCSQLIKDTEPAYTHAQMLAYGERIKVEAAEKVILLLFPEIKQSILSIDHEALIEKK